MTFSIGETLNELLKRTRMSESELAREINVPKATINRLTSGRTPDPRASTLQAIASYFNVSIDQLLGKSAILGVSTTLNKGAECAITLSDLGNMWNLQNSKPLPEILAVKISGDSMWPQFQENMILVIDTKRAPKNRDFVLAFVKKSNEIMFRQLILDGKQGFLQPINRIFQTVEIDSKDKIIGVVTQTKQDF